MVRKKSKKRISLKQLKRDYKVLTSRSLKFGLFEGLIKSSRKFYRNNKTAVHLTAGALAVTGTVAAMHYRNKNQIKKREQEIEDSKKQMEAMKIDYASGKATAQEEIKVLKEITSIESQKLRAAEAREQALKHELELKEEQIKIETQRTRAQQQGGNPSEINSLTDKLKDIEQQLASAKADLSKKDELLKQKEKELVHKKGMLNFTLAASKLTRERAAHKIKGLNELNSIESEKLKASLARERALQEKLKLEEQQIKLQDEKTQAQRDGNLSEVNSLTARLNIIEKSLIDATSILDKKQEELARKEQEIKLLQDSLRYSVKINLELAEKKNRELMNQIGNDKYKEEHCRNKQQKIDRIMEVLEERKIGKTIKEAYDWFIERLKSRSPVSIEMYNGTLDNCIKNLEEYITECGQHASELNEIINKLKRFKKEFNIYYVKHYNKAKSNELLGHSFPSNVLQQTVGTKKYTRTLDDAGFRDYDKNTRKEDRRRIPTSSDGFKEAFFFGKKRKG